MEFSDRQAPRGAVPAPGLLILTGASHTGKTTVAQAILDRVGGPAAFLSVDDVLANTIARPPASIWAQIPLAYELLSAQLETLLGRGWFVVLESTFTYVPDDGEPEFHAAQLKQMVEIAQRQTAPWLLVQLRAGADVARARASQTRRLAADIVDRTAELHRSAELPEPSQRLETDGQTPDELALRVLTELANSSY